MSEFSLHSRLAADTSLIADWPLCRVLLMEDARWPWAILVPRRANLTDIIDLPEADRALLMEEMARMGTAIRALPGVAKLNVAALGNQVAQLHVHVIGRHPGDAAWPDPVCGRGAPEAYDPARKAALLAELSKA